MNPIEDKYFVFIVSGGRTGTKFLGDVLGSMIDDCFSVHEPDVLSLHPKYRPWSRIKTFGVKHMIIDRLRGKSGIRNLSQRFLSGKISQQQLASDIQQHRENYYDSISQNLIIESYSGWYGCLPAIEKLFTHYRVVVVTRHPKTWIESNMKWGTMYGEKDRTSFFGQERLNPKMMNDTEYIEPWKTFGQFEKLCWAYRTIYGNILKSEHEKPNVQTIKFESLFEKLDNYANLKKLLQFVSGFENKNFDFQVIEGILEKKIHASNTAQKNEAFEWTKQRLAFLKNTCAETATQLGYKL